MSKPAVQTVHLLQIADSLRAQNEAIGALLMRIETMHGLAEVADIAQLRVLIAKLHAEAQRTRRAVWPQDEEIADV